MHVWVAFFIEPRDGSNYRMDANSHERNLADAVLAVMKERTDGT